MACSTAQQRKPDEPDQPNPNASGPAEDRLTIHKYLSYPSGESASVVVLYMNFYTKNDWTYVPCEIAMVAFSLRDGINLSNPEAFPAYWTLVDPIVAPYSFGIEAHNNAEEYGVPDPGFCKAYQDFGKITNQIDTFLRKFKNETAGFTFVFCSMKRLASYTSALNWLYGKVGKPFPFKLFPLECLLVTLSVGGLDLLVREENFQSSLPEMIESIQKTVADCEYIKSSEIDFSRRSSMVSSSIRSFISTTRTSEKSYHYLRKSLPRVASKFPEKYPAAMLGKFLYEDHAEEYLDISEFLHDETLACPYHREDPKFMGYEDGKKPRWKDEDDRPSSKLVHCALLNALRQVYLTIDALVVNYPGIKPKKRSHYPKSSVASTVSKK